MKHKIRFFIALCAALISLGPISGFVVAEETQTPAWAGGNIEVTKDATSVFYGGKYYQGSTGWTAGNTYSLTTAGTFSNGTVNIGSTAEGTGTYNLARLVGGAISAKDLTLDPGDGKIIFSGNTVNINRATNASANSLGAGGGLVYAGNSLVANNVEFSGNTTTGLTTYIMGGVLGSYINQASGLNNVSVSNNNTMGERVAGAVAAMSGESGISSTRYFYITGNSSFTGNTSTASGASAYDGSKQVMRAVEGGAIHSEANLFLGGKPGTVGSGNAVIAFSNNTAQSTADGGAAGGALFANRSSYILTDNNKVTFTGNTASSDSGIGIGGALYAGRSSVEPTIATPSYEINFTGKGNIVTFGGDTAELGNKATGVNAKGGAIAAEKCTNSDSTITVPVSVTLGAGNTYVFKNNSAVATGSTGPTNAQGGAIYAQSDVTIAGGSKFIGNSVSGGIGSYNAYRTGSQGGAIYAEGNIYLSGNNTFQGNSATGAFSMGGAISNPTGNITIDGTNLFEGNSADCGGGAIAMRGGSGVLTILPSSNNIFRNNSTSAMRCAGIMCMGKVRMAGTNLFEDNHGMGAAALYSWQDIEISGNNTFTGNVNVDKTDYQISAGAISSNWDASKTTGYAVTFKGDGSKATFSGNGVLTSGTYGEADAVIAPADIYAFNSVCFQDKGEYSLGGGVITPNLSIKDGAKVSFGSSSVSNWYDPADEKAEKGIALTLDNATLELNLGAGNAAFTVSSFTHSNATLNLYTSATEAKTQIAMTNMAGSASPLTLAENTFVISDSSGLVCIAGIDSNGNIVVTSKAVETGKVYNADGEAVASLAAAVTGGHAIITNDQTIDDSHGITGTKENPQTVAIQSNSKAVQTISSGTANVGTAEEKQVAIFKSTDADSQLNLALSNVKVEGLAIDTAGVAYINGKNSSFIHSGNLDTVIKAAWVTFSDADVVIGSTIESGTTTITNDSTVYIGADGGTEKNNVTTTGNLSIENSTVFFDLFSATNFDELAVGETLTIKPGTKFSLKNTADFEASAGDSFAILTAKTIEGLENLILAGNWGSWAFSVTGTAGAGQTLTATAVVPEPSSIILLLCGLAGVWYLRRKRSV